MEFLGKKSGNKNAEPSTNPQKPTKQTSLILNAAGFAFNQPKFNSPGIKSFSEILHNTKPHNQTIDEGSDSSDDDKDDDETVGSDSSSTTRVEQVKPKIVHQNQNVNDIQTNKKPLAKVSAANIITDFNKFEFDSQLRKLGGRAANVQSDISPRNIKSNLNTEKTVKSDFVSGPTAYPARIKSNQMMPVEEPNYNRSDICSDVSWGSDPGQQNQQQHQQHQQQQQHQQHQHQQSTNPTVKVNPNFIIGNQNFQQNYATHFKNIPNKNEWGTKSLDSRSEIMYSGTDKVVSSRHNNVARNPRLNPNFPSGNPKTMSDVTYQPKELRTDVLHYNDPECFSYGGNSHQRKPTVPVTARIPYSIDENEHSHTYARDTNQQHKPRVVVEPQRKVVLFPQLDEEDEEQVESDDNDTVQNAEEESDKEIDELLNMTEDESIQRKLLELHLSNKDLEVINKSLAENIKEQSFELESCPSFDSLLKSQNEQLEHITSLENTIKNLISKLSDQETQIKKIKDENNER
ncbi:10297_t:CDS:2 [Funneliformis geosporum]|uniref:3334_t:CDS:1 n=1 Tax=Funneliformis geosporum TaxID=1117311 RepID=A0A9W4SCX0_9GLOM|nr:3334_t:CDS:2 [Funneliformis geosporum]CAI2169314.1 10297_t:CDS:2 [Funneliformis geosporum]